MIRPNKKIGIVYCGNSVKYVEALEKAIMEKKKEGYCIETIVVNDKLLDMERAIEKRVFSNLDKCDYGIVFLTKDLEVETNKFVSKPNVLLELGYLRGRLKREYVWCITDFVHKEIEEQTYLMPSDYIGEVSECIDKKNYETALKKVVEKFITVHKVVRIKGYDANDLVGSLILNPDYKSVYEELFTGEQLSDIERYSIRFQLQEIFNMWLEEKNKIDVAGQIIYLYERIVFIPFFPEEIVGEKIMEFLSIEDNENEYVYASRKILDAVHGYLNYKRKRPRHESASFYLKQAEEIQKQLDVFHEVEIAPIIECVAHNYMGLCHLNAYYCLSGEAAGDEQRIKMELEKAKENFGRVIQLSERKFSSKADVYSAFAKYNLARVLRNLKCDADLEYHAAMDQRKFLSKCSCFPQIFKLNFSLEKIHAEIEYCEYLREKKLVYPNEFKEKMKELDNELSNIKHTPAADVSLFKTLEEKLKKCGD